MHTDAPEDGVHVSGGLHAQRAGGEVRPVAVDRRRHTQAAGRSGGQDLVKGGGVGGRDGAAAAGGGAGGGVTDGAGLCGAWGVCVGCVCVGGGGVCVGCVWGVCGVCVGVWVRVG